MSVHLTTAERAAVEQVLRAAGYVRVGTDRWEFRDVVDLDLREVFPDPFVFTPKEPDEHGCTWPDCPVHGKARDARP